MATWIRLIVDADIVIRGQNEEFTGDPTLIQVKHLGQDNLENNYICYDNEGDVFIAETVHQNECSLDFIKLTTAMP